MPKSSGRRRRDGNDIYVFHPVAQRLIVISGIHDGRDKNHGIIIRKFADYAPAAQMCIDFTCISRENRQSERVGIIEKRTAHGSQPFPDTFKSDGKCRKFRP